MHHKMKCQMKEISNKKAIIIGAGIAGPAMAMQLQKLTIKASIFEARTEKEMNQGVFLGLTPNGLNVLREFVNPEKLKEDYTPGKMYFFNSQDQKIGELNTLHQLENYGAETIQIKRAKVSEELRKAAITRGIDIYYGKKLVYIKQEEGSVTAQFEDGTETSADFLIACDGTYSVCRNIIFPDMPKPTYTKQLSTGAFVQKDDLKHLFGSIRMTFGKKAFFAYAVTNKDEVWWFNNYYQEKEPTREEINTSLQTQIKTHLLEIHKDDPDPIPAIIKATDHIFVYPIYDIPSLPKWYKGNVCLIGDAAHATAPHIGQGASLALEDTIVLAKCIRDYDSLTSAFEKFQEIRRPRVEKLIKTARKIGNSKSKSNPIAVFFRDVFLKHFIKFEVKKVDWIYRYKEDWNEPINQ